MTELSFLLSLLLEHKLPLATRKAVTERIKEVEAQLSRPAPAASFGMRPMAAPAPQAIPAHLQGQSPSTIAAMMRHEQQGAAPAPPPAAIVPEAPMPEAAAAAAPVPVAQVAHTAAAQQALAARQALINRSIAGPVKGAVAAPKTHA